MTLNDGFERTVSDWLDEQAGHGVPGYLDEALARTSRTRQRPWWSSLERWLPMQTAFTARTGPMNRFVWTLVVLGLLVLAAAVLLLAGVGQRRIPHFGSVANGSIAFVDGANMKVAGPDGLDARVVATLPSGVESLRYSPDGTHLAYRTTASPGALVVAQADGTHQMVVSNGMPVAKASQPGPAGGGFAWSPDSRRLVFTWMATADRRSIDIVDADGSDMVPLVSDAVGPAVDRFDPAWSPDGQWISFFATETPGTVAINVVHPDGTGARRLPTSSVDLGYLELTWAPDPTQRLLEYVSGAYETGNDVEIFDLATSKETRVASGFFGTWSPDARSIAWWDDRPGSVGAPDAGGTRVARVAEVLAGGHPDITVFHGVTNISCYSQIPRTDAICGPAAWSPDSAWIFGPDPSGGSIVFSTVDAPRTIRSINLDHPYDLSNGPQGSLAWQPVAP